MYDIKADPKNNILLMRLEGNMSDDELKEGVDMVISEIKKLKKGYTIINDISKMKPASPIGAKEIVRAQTYVLNNGVGRIIRVTENPVTKMQFQNTGEMAGYTAIEASSLKEAYELIVL